jgi:penicillin-binding protein 2
VTPLQANVLTSAIANNGQYCPPFLTFIRQKTTHCEKMPISGQTLEELVTGMTMACEPGGTGAPFFQFEPKVACKTGTAETGDKTDSHAWFTVFAPVDNPQIVLTVLVENGGEGSVVAAPIAKEALDYWFHGRNP